ncbi:MAG: hypothetical protein ORN21_01330 [Methylophilaceae bacterium]|nr:hypothetical protein [Methylophilaceae bacterium]
MKCKASATQEAIPINEIGEPPSSAPQSNSPVQTILQRSRNEPGILDGSLSSFSGHQTGQDYER